MNLCCNTEVNIDSTKRTDHTIITPWVPPWSQSTHYQCLQADYAPECNRISRSNSINTFLDIRAYIAHIYRSDPIFMPLSTSLSPRHCSYSRYICAQQTHSVSTVEYDVLYLSWRHSLYAGPLLHLIWDTLRPLSDLHLRLSSMLNVSITENNPSLWTRSI